MYKKIRFYTRENVGADDIVLPAEELDTDAFVREVIQGPEFQRAMGTDEFHYLLGKYVAARGKKLGLKDSSVLATAYECGIPIFTSSPGDSSIGMNVAAMADSNVIGEF